MGGRQCPGCKIQLLRDDPLPPATCPSCERQFHALCLDPNAAGLPVCCTTCIELKVSTKGTARGNRKTRPLLRLLTRLHRHSRTPPNRRYQPRPPVRLPLQASQQSDCAQLSRLPLRLQHRRSKLTARHSLRLYSLLQR